MVRLSPMSHLENFSIETDNVVLLQFKDGQTKRVAVWQLSRHLLARDLQRVRAAMKLRQDFLRDHMPKSGLIITLAAGLVAVAWGGGAFTSELLRSPAPIATESMRVRESVQSTVALEVAPVNDLAMPATPMAPAVVAPTTIVGSHEVVGPTAGQNLQPPTQVNLSTPVSAAPPVGAPLAASATSPQANNSGSVNMNSKLELKK
jgi:hypothetical protein